MITRFALSVLTVSTAALALTFFTPFSQSHAKANGFQGATYSEKDGRYIDFRNVSTLGEFDRIVAEERWNGIKAADVLTQFAKFNDIHGSAALREIWRNVLLGDFSGLRTSNATEQSQIMAGRLRLLNRLGFFDEAVRLYQQSSQQKPIPEIIARHGVEALALSGSADGACLEVLMASKYLGSKEWRQDAALCAAYFNEDTRAQTIYDSVAKESGSGFRAVFKMIESKSGGTIQPDMPALWRTLLLARGASVGQSSLNKADGVTLAALAANKHIPLSMRLAAASRAADYGTIGADRLRKLYETAADAPIEGNSQPAIYSRARFTFEGNARAQIVRQGLQALNPRTNIKGHVYMWIVDKLTLQVDRLGWFAKDGYALMMATGRFDSAKMYYDAGHLEKSPLAIVQAMQTGKPWSKTAQEAWIVGMKKAGKAAQIDKSFLLVKSFDQEDKLALNKFSAVRTDATKPLPLLQDSVNKGGRGLTLITALNHLAKAKKLSAVNPSEAAEIVRVLAKEGLFGERKKIALEIFLQTVL